MTSPYKSLHDLPQLAGLCSVEQATLAVGSVDTSVTRLKRLHYLLKRLSEQLVARITAEPIYELKMLFSHHAYLLAEQVQSIRQRVSEMREPPLGLDKVPDEGLEQAMDELQAAPDLLHYLVGAYRGVLPNLLRQCELLNCQAHPLADAPTVRIAKLIRFELQEVLQVGQQATSCIEASQVPSTTSREKCLQWLADIQACLDYGEPADNQPPSTDPPERTLPPRSTHSQPHFDAVPRRDDRFRDPYNAGVNPEAFLYDPKFSSRDKTLMMYYKRLRELDVPEMMASILAEIAQEEPWEFYYEMVRQLWDEARHAMMGEVGFVALGIDWTQIPINFTWSLNLNTQLSPRERHGVLFFIEQGLMPRTGKRYEWETGVASGDDLSAVFQDFDWADEVLHAQIGRRWYVPKFDSLNAALAYGDKCWSKVLSHWEAYRQQGLTQHRNWWPELYQQACRHWNVEPDPAALAFSEDYQDSRADLKQIEK